MIRFYPYRLLFKQAWSRGSLQEQRGWILQINQGRYNGLGDCAWLDGKLPVTAALNNAYLDLKAKQAGLSLRHDLNPQAGDRVKLNQMAGSPTRIQPIKGRVVKLKLGLAMPEQEIAALHQLAADHPQVIWRLDANRLWSFEQALSFLKAIADLPIDYIEEPLAQPSFGDWSALQQHTGMSIAIDESLSACLPQLWQQPDLKIIVLKPSHHGGIAAAYQLAQQALVKNKRVIISSALESMVGLRAAMQLAAAIDPHAQEYHGLWTFDWLLQDLAPPPTLEGDGLKLDSSFGIGLAQIQDLQL